MTPSTIDMTKRENSLEHLTGVICSKTKGTGNFNTLIPSLTFFRREEISTPSICMTSPSVVLVTQGVKKLWFGSNPYLYDVSNFLITSLDLPAYSEVITASKEAPCVGVTLNLDMKVISELIAQGGLPVFKESSSGTSVGMGEVTQTVLSPFVRLLDLLDEPGAIPVLSPLIIREIHYRLLLSSQSAKLRQIASIDSKGHRISKAIDWLKINYASSFRVDELAAMAQMSTPTFHQHFRQLTSMSPLQYQKWLRLNEAKRLMLNEYNDVSRAAFKVGYESPSQFSREYSRLFGVSPKRDIALMKEKIINDRHT